VCFCPWGGDVHLGVVGEAVVVVVVKFMTVEDRAVTTPISGQFVMHG